MAATPPVCDFGWKAIDATLPGVDGREHRLFDLAGPNGLVVAFICNHCPYVKAVIDRIVRDAADLSPLGIGFVAINSNDADQPSGGLVSRDEALRGTQRFRLPLSA